jgi:hypothetical protein
MAVEILSLRSKLQNICQPLDTALAGLLGVIGLLSTRLSRVVPTLRDVSRDCTTFCNWLSALHISHALLSSIEQSIRGI